MDFFNPISVTERFLLQNTRYKNLLYLLVFVSSVSCSLPDISLISFISHHCFPFLLSSSTSSYLRSALFSPVKLLLEFRLRSLEFAEDGVVESVCIVLRAFHVLGGYGLNHFFGNFF